MAKSKMAKNITYSLTLQVCSVICGFIIPHLILNHYGSEVNGLVNSISQFLSFISLLDFGVGAVVQSALYRPLAEKNQLEINQIVSSAEKFFQKIGMALSGYVLFLLMAYPFFSKQNLGFVYTSALIAAISISTFSQYYFGVVDRLLLTADQKGYVQYKAQIVTLLLNTLACTFLIKLGCGIHVVKLTTSVIYLGRPVFLRAYVNRHYVINRKECYAAEPIQQKWNGIAQHISSVVLNNTDIAVLTIMSSVLDVSVYSVYNLIVSGLRQLFEVSTSSVEAALGELWAKKEYEQTKRLFQYSEWLIHTCVTYVFVCTVNLIVPFVLVYTNNITDAEYKQPVFAMLIVLAYAIHCYRLPYHIMIKATGNYKQTQSCYIIATVINVAVSIIAVKFYRLIGVAVGTLAAMLYQMIWMANYNRKHFIKEKASSFLKQLFADAISFMASGFLLPNIITLTQYTYVFWIIMAVKTALVVGIIIVLINILIYKEYVRKAVKNLIH